MKKLFFRISCILAVSLLICAFPANAFETVNLKINGQKLKSPYSPIISGDSTLVPLRPVMEQLGWVVGWDDETSSITVTSGIKTIGLQIDSDTMTVDGTPVKLAAAPCLIGEVTYAPIRAVSEALGAIVSWDANTNTAAICVTESTSTLTIGDYQVTTGTTVSDLISKCGEPSYTCVGENGLVWYVYSAYPSAFMAIATDAGIVCGYYSNSPSFSTTEGYSFGRALWGNFKDIKTVAGNDYTIKLFYDLTERSLYGIKYMLNGYSADYDAATAFANQARMGLDIINSFRNAHGKSLLSWSTAAATSCTDHCNYICASGVLTNTGADGSTGLDRYLKVNPDTSWKAWAHISGAGYDNIFTCVNKWINSDYYRNVILSDKTHAGIGFVCSDSGKLRYSTAMFLIK